MTTTRTKRHTANFTAEYGTTHLVDATAGAVVVTMPRPSVGLGAITVKKTDATSNAVTLTATSPALIDGAGTAVLNARYMAVTVTADGNNWQATARVLVRPAAPTIGVAVGDVGQATVAFTANGDGGVAPTSYTATSSPGGITATGTTSPITVPGLTADTPYTFTVHATSPLGNSPESAASNSVTPTAAPSAPGAPTIGTATAGDTTATANWTAGTTGGSPITGYQVKIYDSAGTLLATDTVGVVLTFTKTGLTNGSDYKFKVAAINAIGTGTLSGFSNTVTPAAPWTPASLGSKLKIWLEGDDLSPGAVAAWNSRSPATANGTQGSSGDRPTAIAGVVNGHTVVEFSGTDFLTLGTSTIISETPGSEYTFVYVAAIPDLAPGTDGWLLARDDNALGRDFGISKGGSLGTIDGWTVAAGVNVCNVAGGTSTDTYHAVTIDSVAGGTRKAYLDGVLSITRADSQVGEAATGATTIGKRTYSGAEGYLQGRIAAIYACTPRCDAGELANLHGYVLGRFGL